MSVIVEHRPWCQVDYVDQGTYVRGLTLPMGSPCREIKLKRVVILILAYQTNSNESTLAGVAPEGARPVEK